MNMNWKIFCMYHAHIFTSLHTNRCVRYINNFPNQPSYKLASTVRLNSTYIKVRDIKLKFIQSHIPDIR